MIRPQPRSTRTDTLFPYATLFRSRGRSEREVGLHSQSPEVLKVARTPRWLERSEEHTSELQSLMRISYAVFCLKKTNKTLSHTLQNYSNSHISRVHPYTSDPINKQYYNPMILPTQKHY